MSIFNLYDLNSKQKIKGLIKKPLKIHLIFKRMNINHFYQLFSLYLLKVVGHNEVQGYELDRLCWLQEDLTTNSVVLNVSLRCR